MTPRWFRRKQRKGGSRVVVRPGLETVALRNRQEAELEVTEEKNKKRERPAGLDRSSGGIWNVWVEGY